MDIAAVIIVYHPGKSIIENILSYSTFTKQVYVMDNSESGSPEFTQEINNLSNCVYINSGENKGIPERLNQASKLAKQAGFSWLLTMDQDSFFTRTNMIAYQSCFITYPGKNTVAMFGVQFENPTLLSDTCSTEKTDRLITSGSIVNLDLLDAIGGFDEKLFIDEADTEYCYKAILKGYDIVQFKNIFLEHNLGKTSYHRSFKDFSKTPRTIHSPFRLYYMTRNFLYLRSKYEKQLPDSVAKSKQALFNKIKNNLLYNKNRFQVIKYIVTGFFDYKKNKMGKYGAQNH